jgi:hypothetical protein
MIAMSVNDFILTMAVSALGMGFITFLIGVIVVVAKVMGKETQTIAAETTKLAQKGITDDVSGLVGNASVLLDSLKDFVRTAAGMGIFLVMTGILLMACAFVLINQIH